MVIVFKTSKNVQEKMIEFYKDLYRPSKPPYSIFQAQSADVVVTLYESGKVMFQGISADIEANIWKDQERHLNKRDIDKEIEKADKKKEKKKEDIKNDTLNLRNISAIGSDEVGTGDFYGPIVVTACFVSKENEIGLIDIGVKDSKLLGDEKIIEIAPKIIKCVDYKSFSLNNKDFNEYTEKGYNMNKIKAVLHNKVLGALKKAHINEYDKIIVDQFAPPKKYFEYLEEANDIVKDITFTPKAETKSIAVACASIISRYLFLKEMDKLSDSIGLTLPKGANDIVDSIGVSIVKKYGFEKLFELCKINFKNTEKIKEKMAK